MPPMDTFADRWEGEAGTVTYTAGTSSGTADSTFYGTAANGLCPPQTPQPGERPSMALPLLCGGWFLWRGAGTNADTTRAIYGTGGRAAPPPHGTTVWRAQRRYRLYPIPGHCRLYDSAYCMFIQPMVSSVVVVRWNFCFL